MRKPIRPLPRIISVLNNVRSLYNVGSIFRTADAYGVERIFLCGYTGAPPRVEISKVALGAERSVAWQHARSTVRVITKLKKEGWIESYEVLGDKPMQEIEVVFAKDRPALTLKRVSKPGRRAYASSGDLKPVLRGFGISVLTTSKGLMTDKEAKKQKIGGEVLCTIY